MALRTWALVMDAMRARILRGFENPDGAAPLEIVSQAASHNLRRLIETGGVEHETAAEIRRGTQLDTQSFVQKVLEFVEIHRRTGDFDRLAIIAAQPILDVIHQEISPALKRTVFVENPTNLTPLAAPDLFERVRDFIAKASKT